MGEKFDKLEYAEMLKVGRHDDAIAYVDKFRGKDPDDPTLKLRAARARGGKGEAIMMACDQAGVVPSPEQIDTMCALFEEAIALLGPGRGAYALSERPRQGGRLSRRCQAAGLQTQDDGPARRHDQEGHLTGPDTADGPNGVMLLYYHSPLWTASPESETYQKEFYEFQRYHQP